MAKKLTEKEKKEKKIRRNVDKFMKNVRAFLASKNGGGVAAEWECILMLLEEYYKQFVVLTEEINSLDSLVATSRYGTIPHPLLAARDKTTVRLESILKSLGLTLKSALSMDIAEPVIESSPLEQFVSDRINKYNK